MRAPSRRMVEAVAVAFVIAIFSVVLVESRKLSADARLFPVIVAVIGALLGVAVLVQLRWAGRRPADEAAGGTPPQIAAREKVDGLGAPLEARAVGLDEDLDMPLPSAERPGEQVREGRWFWLWLLGFCGAIWGFGFYVGLPIIGAAFVIVDTRKWVTGLCVGLGLWVYLYVVFRMLLGIRWFTGIFL